MSLKLSEGNIYGILQAIWEAPQYARAREFAHKEGHPARWDYIVIAGKAVQAENMRLGGDALDIGCNYRRARVGDLSMDGLSVKNPADGRYYFEDVIASAGSADATIKYRHPFNDGALLRAVEGGPYAPEGYADPREQKTHFTYDAVPSPGPDPTPTPTPTPTPAPVDLAPVLELLRQSVAALADVQATCALVRQDATVAASAAIDAKNMAEQVRQRLVLLDGLEAPPRVFRSNRLPILGTITLTAEG